MSEKITVGEARVEADEPSVCDTYRRRRSQYVSRADTVAELRHFIPEWLRAERLRCMCLTVEQPAQHSVLGRDRGDGVLVTSRFFHALARANKE